MQDAILDLVTRWQYVSFANLEREIPGFRGDFGMSAQGNPHLILWPFISQPGLDALNQLLTTERIFLHQAQVLTYFIDGMVPSFPVARSNRIYKRDHWLPACFCSHPVKDAPKKLKRKARR